MSVRIAAAAAALTALLALSLGAGAASAAVDASSSLRIAFLPQKTFRGQAASLSIVVRPLSARCSASIVYADGRKQALPARTAASGRVTWKWIVPLQVKLGAATVNIGCGRAGSAARVFVVTGRPTEPARIEVEKQGFSQRVKGLMREVSYGIVLRNISADNDALEVTVHVNMLDATGVVRKTDAKPVRIVGSKDVYYLGASTMVPEHWIPISTMELQVRIGAQQPKALRVPKMSDIRVVQSLYDPGYTAGVFLEALNDEPLYVFSGATVSAVVFDAAGNVIGGGTGFAPTPLAPGVRAQYNASMGFSPIPFDRVAGAGVSIIGNYTRDT